MSQAHHDHLIRGGQTLQHWVRMAAQVFKAGIAFGAGIFAVVYIGLCATYYKPEYLHVTWSHWMATFAVEQRGEPQRVMRYKDPNLGWIERTAESIFLDEGVNTIVTDYRAKATYYAWIALIPSVAAFLIAFIVFYFQGRRLDGDEHVRGTHLVSHKDLQRWTEQKWKAYRKQFGKTFKTGPQYTVAGIKFPPNAVEAQTAICGTVGTGKSNAIKELLTTVREHNGRAVIYDRMGAYVRDFYDPSRDVIINPFDLRSKVWTPFAEAETAQFFTQMAEVLIPDRQSGGDQFWTQAARIVFDYAAQQIFKSGTWSNKRLRDAILEIPAEELSELIQATPGKHFFNEDIKKTSGSIRANLIAELRFLEFLRDDGEVFAIRDWIKSDKEGFVFLTGDAEHAAATRNIISTIFEIAANALMTCEESNDPRVWFIMDEVPTLNRMPFLPKSLAEIRQFGGAFVVGYQVYSQLEDIYGDKAAQTIAGNLNNRIIFNTPDADTAERFSKALGSEDVEERRESITVGAHETRDGVGFMSQRTERRIVTASQIQSLPQFEGYVRFAYDAPTAFVRFQPFETEPKAPKFMPYSGSAIAKGSMEQRSAKDIIAAGGNAADVPFLRRSKAQQLHEFETWWNRILAAKMPYMEGRDVDHALDWKFFAHERMRGRKSAEIGPPPMYFGRMLDGTGYEFSEGFDPGPLPSIAAAILEDEVADEDQDSAMDTSEVNDAEVAEVFGSSERPVEETPPCTAGGEVQSAYAERTQSDDRKKAEPSKRASGGEKRRAAASRFDRAGSLATLLNESKP